jgi:site-specific DNA recombinase
LLDVDDVGMGHQTKLRWNDPQVWMRSVSPSHPAIVTAETFQLAQDQLAVAGRGNKPRMPRATPRAYQLRGLLFCGLCDRRIQGNFNPGLPHCRCRFPSEYALANHVIHPRAVYLRENQVIPSLDAWVAKIFTPVNIETTLDQLAGSQPDADSETSADARALADCDRKLVNYRAALEAGTDPHDRHGMDHPGPSRESYRRGAPASTR